MLFYGMTLTTLVELSDVSGKPKVKLALPAPLRLGDPVRLRFRLRRQNVGRTEVLDVDGPFRVTTVGFDAAGGPPRQVLTVESASGLSPTWKAIKKEAPAARRMAPARSPRTAVG